MIQSMIRYSVTTFLSKTLVLSCLLLSQAQAQLSIEIGGVGAQQYPIAVLGFVGASGSLGDARADEITATVRSDLSRSGLFKLIQTSQKLAETSDAPISELRSTGADTVAWGSIARLADGRIEARIKLQDTVRGTLLDNSVLTMRADPRFAGHQIADRLYEKITGQKGFFTARLAYVTQLARDNFELRVAEWDGQYPQTALRSREPILSPTFSSEGTRLAYVSFEGGKASIYTHDLATGARNQIANYRGTNSAPSFAPDGKSITAALSKDGLAQLYSLGLDGSSPKRLSNTAGIDTEPSFASDGTLYFVSDRGGQPQIYKMPGSGGAAQRVTFKGDYNISPAVSPDRRWLAFISRREGRFAIVVMDLATQAETVLSDSGTDESPSFTANSQFVLYASRRAGKGVLMLASIDGKVRTVLSLAGADVREPTFSNVVQ